MKIFSSLRGNVLLGSLLAIAVPAFAVPITGGFGTTATGVLTYANATNTVHKIDFCPTDPTSPGTPTASCSLGGPTPGMGIIQAQGGTGTFSSLIAPTPGTILDLVDQPGNPPYTYFPVGTPNQTVNSFLTVSTFPGFNFQGNQFVNQTCSGPTVLCLGGFVLTQVGTNVSVSFTVNGTIVAAAFDPTPFSYIISGQFNNTTLAAVAAAAQSTSGIFSNTWSGSLITTSSVPEPGTVTMLGIGAIAMFFGRMRSKRRSQL